MKPEEITLENLSNINMIEDEKTLLCVGLLITIYFENAHESDKRSAALDCAEDYLKLTGDKLRWTTDPKTHRWKAIVNEIAPPWLREWCMGLDEDDSWSFCCHGGQNVDDASMFTMEVVCSAAWEEELSYFTATLPINWFTEHGGSLAGLVQGWCSKLQAYHGYSGLGIISALDTSTSRRAEEKVYALGRRFPCLEVDYPISHLRHLSNGIKGINWLTILGSKWVEQLGGTGKLRSQLDNSFIFHNYSGGLVIQAGPHPQMGDVNRQNIPELYRILSRVLKPVRVDYPVGMQHGETPNYFDKERTNEWLARFDV